ncbi:gasdermin Eb [Aplochiton taeniatus]
MAHPLIKQTREKHKEVFGIVKERIVTTQPFSVVEDVQQGGQLGGQLSLCWPKPVKVSLKPNGSLQKDSKVTLEIPTNTVVAYSLIELQVKANGHFEMCLMPDTLGCFEVDGPVQTFVGVSAPKDTSSNSCLKQELDWLSPHFQLLSACPPSTRSSLLQLLRTTMEDRQAVSLFENVLEQVCSGESPVLEDVEEEGLRQNIQALLDLSDQAGDSVQRSIHLIISALDGEVYDSTERLFSVSNVILKKEGNTLRTEVGHDPDNHALVLCIAVKGLASLAHNA